MICAGEERHALYRFYDAREELLYVGITDEPWRRWREHVRTKPWYPRVKHQAITWYEDKGVYVVRLVTAEEAVEAMETLPPGKKEMN